MKATNPIGLQQEMSDLTAAGPIYDNAHELLATAGADSPQAMSFQQCVAYGKLPFQQQS